jgi:hypothetical protein
MLLAYILEAAKIATMNKSDHEIIESVGTIKRRMLHAA